MEQNFLRYRSRRNNGTLCIEVVAHFDLTIEIPPIYSSVDYYGEAISGEECILKWSWISLSFYGRTFHVLCHVKKKKKNIPKDTPNTLSGWPIPQLPRFLTMPISIQPSIFWSHAPLEILNSKIPRCQQNWSTFFLYPKE